MTEHDDENHTHEESTHDFWESCFKHMTFHISELFVRFETIPLPENLVRDARTSVRLQSGDIGRSYRDRVMEVLERLLYLADKVVPDCFKDEPSHTTFILDEWSGYDSTQPWDSQMHAFYQAGGYDGLAESRSYVEWVQDILLTQGRWKMILQALKLSLEGDNLSDINLDLADEPPLTLRTRRKELEIRLKLHGLELRPDSRVCEKYMRYGGDLDKVVEVTGEMYFLFTFTEYPKLMAALHRRKDDPTRSSHTMEKMREYNKLKATDEFMKTNVDRLHLVPSSLFIRLGKR